MHLVQLGLVLCRLSYWVFVFTVPYFSLPDKRNPPFIPHIERDVFVLFRGRAYCIN